MSAVDRLAVRLSGPSQVGLGLLAAFCGIGIVLAVLYMRSGSSFSPSAPRSRSISSSGGSRFSLCCLSREESGRGRRDRGRLGAGCAASGASALVCAGDLGNRDRDERRVPRLACAADLIAALERKHKRKRRVAPPVNKSLFFLVLADWSERFGAFLSGRDVVPVCSPPSHLAEAWWPRCPPERRE